ncbi:hypothetical protein FPV67DRAFT_1483142 [Lyophyllum atratum]|nr:hypothetical protein FPV67DRAFT_1483142 [Lyophyllum atratum]
MMSPSVLEGMAAPDFVMKRKRKRSSAVDPCLGFYTLSPKILNYSAVQEDEQNGDDVKTSLISEPQPETTTPLHSRNLNCPPIPETSARSSDSDFSTPSAHSSDPVPIPVEVFLQRNARRILRVKKYGRRKNRIIESSSPTVPDMDLGQHDDSDGLARLSNPIQNYMIDAEGDIGPSKSAAKLLNAVSRQPLPLVPVSIQNFGKTKPRAIRPWSTVDPKKGVSFRQSSFSRRDNKTSSNYRPLNKWKNLVDSSEKSEGVDSVNKIQKIMSSPRAGKRTTNRCPPLLFVPLAVAEEAYTAKSHTVNKTKGERVTPSPVHGLRSSSPPPLLLVPTLTTFQPSSNQEVTPRSSFELTLLDSCTLPLNVLPCTMTSPAHPPRSHAILGDAPRLCEAISLPLTIGHKNDFQSFRKSLTEKKKVIALDNHRPRTAPSTAGDTSTSRKPMKPFASLLDGFLDRLRTATQLQKGTTSSLETQQDLRISALSSSVHTAQGTRHITGHLPPPATSSVTHPESINNTVVSSSPSLCSPGFLRSVNPDTSPFCTRRGRPTKRTHHHVPSSGHLNPDHRFSQDFADASDRAMEIDYGTAFGDAMSDEGLESGQLSSSQELEFPPYRPPTTPFDIHASLRAYSEMAGY